MKIKNPGRLSFLSLLALSIFLLAACASGPRPEGQSLHPAEHGAKGYSSIGTDHLFEDENVRISIRHVKKGEAGAAPFFEGLLEKDYAVFKLAIENKSTGSVIYNTAYTVLTSDAGDYEKPLDFTDLYDIAGDDRALAGLKGKFYDLNATVAPGERMEKLLIFRPLSIEATEAGVAIKEIYIGTSTSRLSFPFAFKGDGPE